MGITIHQNVTFNHLPEILSLGYDYIVLDMGVLNQYTLPEFWRNDIHFVLGHSYPTKGPYYHNFINFIFSSFRGENLNKKHLKELKIRRNISFLDSLGLKDNAKNFYKQYQVSLDIVPFIQNPFQLTSNEWRFFQALLKDFSI